MNTTSTPRLPQEIDAHLMVAALEGVCVELHGGSLVCRGAFDLADGFGEVGYAVDVGRTGIGRWRTGQALEAIYELGDRSFRFGTRLIGRTSEARLRLVRPLNLGSQERRLVPRVATPDACTLTSGSTTLMVLDLSNQGARVLWPADAPPPLVGQTTAGWLAVPELSAIACESTVKHVVQAAGGWSVGLQFSGMRRADCWALTQRVYGRAATGQREDRAAG